MRTRTILSLSILSFLLVACAVKNSPLPTPASTFIGQFIWQTDGVCGYRMLRPERWTASESECRAYVFPDSQGQDNQLIFRVANYEVFAQQTDGLIAQYELFEKDPSLSGWTKSVEQMWQSNGIESILEDTLPQAKIYSLHSPGSSDTQILALTIDQKQPLVLSLNATGEYADSEYLHSEHLWEDFVTMVKSLSAINYDPSNVAPSLP